MVGRLLSAITEMERIESGAVGKEADEVDRFLEVGSTVVGVDNSFVDIDQTIAEIIAQAMPLMDHEIADRYAYHKPQQPYQRKEELPVKTGHAV